MHRHHERLVDLAKIGRQHLDVGLGVQHDRALHAKRPDALKLDVEIAVRLDVYLERLRAGGGELLDVEVGARHHEMDVAVERGAGLPAEVDDRRTEAHVGHEVRIHDVDVQGVCARRLGAPRLFGEASEVCRKKRRKDLYLQESPFTIASKSAVCSSSERTIWNWLRARTRLWSSYLVWKYTSPAR